MSVASNVLVLIVNVIVLFRSVAGVRHSVHADGRHHEHKDSSHKVLLSSSATGVQTAVHQSDMHQDSFYEEHAELITWLNTTHTVGWDANEHMDMGDTAWTTFQNLAPGAMRSWSQQHSKCRSQKPEAHACFERADGNIAYIDDSLWHDVTDPLKAGHGENEGVLSYGDYVFLAGDFFADDKNGGNLEFPSGNDFLQKDPMKPLHEIRDGYATGQWWGGFGNVPMLVGYVRGLKEQQGAYQGANFVEFVDRQARFIALTGGRYKDLAFANHNHFGGLAKREYQRYHALALDAAFKAGKSLDGDGWQSAFEIEAMGAHYLTDLFSAGHVRVPRTELQAICTDEHVGGVVYGYMESKIPGGVPAGGFLTKMMHDEDAQLGVVQQGVGSGTWISYGDSTWFQTWSVPNKAKAIQAVVQGLYGVLYSFLDGIADKAKPDPYPSFIPEMVRSQPTYPLFRSVRSGAAYQWKVGTRHAVTVEMRMSPPTAKPDYVVLDQDCRGITGRCITCANAVSAAEIAKANAMAVTKARMEAQPLLS